MSVDRRAVSSGTAGATTLVELSARQIADQVCVGAVSRVEVVQAHLDQVASANPALGALVAVRAEEALREARQADRAGLYRGALDGVPVSVKAEYDVAGLPTTHGNHSLTGQPAGRDAPVVSRLRARGAILIGKGNQPDFAMRWNTFSSQLGWTRNPRDPSRSVGGSSGGDAAAVAAGMVAVGFGTDLAGSIRVPAACCAIYGLRSTPGRIPYAPQALDAVRSPAVEAMASQGPLARSVDDLSLAFAVTAGASAEHPFSLPSADARPLPDHQLLVARLVTQAGAQVAPEMVEQVDLVCAALESAGHQVEDAAFPGAERAPDLWGELLCTELRLRVLPRLRQVMDPSCFDHIDTLSQLWPTLTDTDDYLARWEEWARLRRALLAWMDRYPLIVSPIAGRPLPPTLEYDHWADAAVLGALTAQMRNSLWPACLGLPALALPNGVQLVTGPHRDELLFAPARAAEAALPPCRPALSPAPGRK